MGQPSDDETTSLKASATAVGTVKKMVLVPKGVLSATASGTVKSKVLILSDDADYCTHTGAKQLKARQTQMLLVLSNIGLDGKMIPVTAGTYEAGVQLKSLQIAVATIGTIGASCSYGTAGTTAVATSGTVTIDALSDAGFRGRYDLMFDGESLTGEFTAPVCDAMDQVFAEAESNGVANGRYIFSCID